jgi:hypothetical protein
MIVFLSLTTLLTPAAVFAVGETTDAAELARGVKCQDSAKKAFKIEFKKDDLPKDVTYDQVFKSANAASVKESV